MIDLIFGAITGPIGGFALKAVRSPIFWKGLACLAVVSAVWFGWHKYNKAIEDAVFWKAHANGVEDALIERIDNEAKLQARLEKLAETEKVLRLERSAAHRRIKELEDEEGRNYLDRPIPDSVLRILREEAPAD